MRSVLILLLALKLEAVEFISKERASAFLHRVARSNRGDLFEELQSGNLERECIEEKCNAEEAFEISDERRIADQLWLKYTGCKRGKYTSGRRLDIPSRRKELRQCLADGDDCIPQACHDTYTALCEDRLGGFTCLCKPGYEGRLCDEAIDNCSPSPCSRSGTNRCENKASSYHCECKSGFQGRHCDVRSDVVIDQTVSPTTARNNCYPSPCNENGTNQCVNNVNSYRCECKTGYQGRHCDVNDNTIVTTETSSTAEINACRSNPCGVHGSCAKEPEGFQCLCDDLYEGRLCDVFAGVDDCRTSGCFENGDCVEISEAFQCQCRGGYDGERCKDINECASSPCQQNCINIPGSYQCTCNAGFLLVSSDPTSCNDIDECAKGSHGCSDSCVNTAGSYECECEPGYGVNSLNKRQCQDIDECLQDNGGCWGRCLNEPGSYTCVCSAGYTTDDDGLTCQDIDECSGTHGCESDCQNTPGSFLCVCAVGFALNYDGKTCRDINECASDAPPCDQRCINSAGKYSCACSRGYQLLNESLCEDVDECLQENGGCEQLCVNNPGSFNCDCPQGYELIGRKCFDFLECASNPCANGQCIEGHLSYKCLCFYGYSGSQCQYEGDPCLDEPCHNGNCSGFGDRFTCFCDPGFIGVTCNDDIDECSIENGNCIDRCINTLGSYTCQCHVGYYQPINGSCVDLDECEDKEACEHLCNNLPGSYECTCRTGYVPNEDGRHCDDLDECMTSPCEQKCINTEGSFICACKEGFRLNNDTVTCDKVNDCSTKSEICHSKVACSGNRDVTMKGHLQIGSKTTDYVTQQLMTTMKKKIEISVKFRTFQSDGLLFLLYDQVNSARVYVNINSGNIQSQFNTSFSSTSLSSSDHLSVSDGLWHAVKLKMVGKKITLRIDDVTIAEATVSRKNVGFTRGSNIYYGGIPADVSLTMTSQFRGCLGNIRVRGVRVEWTPSKRNVFREHKGCFADVDNSGHYFGGRGYARMDSLQQQRDFKFSVKFRTGMQSGILVAMGNKTFSLLIEQGKVKARLRRDDEAVILTSQSDSKLVCHGKWVNVNYKINQGGSRLRVDGITSVGKGLGGFSSRTTIYIGGLPDRPPPGFHGNMKRIVVNGRRLSLSRSTDFRGTNIWSMPRD